MDAKKMSVLRILARTSFDPAEANTSAVTLRRWLVACAIALASVLLMAPAKACGTSDPGGDPNKPGQCAGVGNPINVMTGNKYQREDDMPALPGVLGLEIVRHYNSAFSGPGQPNGVLGRGWRLSYETEVLDRWGKIQVLEADGSRVIFDRDPKAPTGCSTPDPANGTMAIGHQQDGQPDYTWTWTDGRKLHFNTAGKLDRITAASGEVVHLLYDSQNVLVRVIDPQGRSLNLVYYDRHAPNQFHGVQFIDTPVGRFAYEYGSTLPKGAGLFDKRQLLANLVRVRLPDHFDPDKKAHALSSRGTTVSTTSRIYHHEDPRNPLLLTGISIETIGADGKTATTRYATFGYDNTGRAILSTHAGNVDKVTLDNSKFGLTVLTNSLGQKTVYRYTLIAGEYRLLEVRGAGCALCGEPNVRYAYNNAGQQISTTKLSEGGQPVVITRTDRDKLGRVIRVSKFTYSNGKPMPAQLQVRFEYQGDRFAPTLAAHPSVISGKEMETRIDYNQAGQPLRVTESGWSPAADGKQAARIERTIRYRYTTINGRSLLAEIDGPLSNGKTNSPLDSDITLFEYDGGGVERRTSTSDSGLTTYDGRLGVLTGIIAPTGRVTTILERDLAGRPTRISEPGGIELGLAFDWRGDVVARRIGNVSEYFSYNGLGQLATVRQATGQVLSYAYDPNGRVIAIYDSQNNRIRVSRNAEGKLLSRDLLNPDGTIAQQADPLRLMDEPEAAPKLPDLAQTVIAWSSSATLFATRGTLDFTQYPDNRPVQFADARGIETRYSFDDFGRLVRVASPDTGVTVYIYDAAGHLISKTNAYGSADASTIRYRYDAAGRVVAEVSPEGKTTIVYGAVGRPVRIMFPGGEERYEYDNGAHLIAHTRIIDGHPFTTRYGYNERGQLSSKILPDGEVLQYHYRGTQHPKAGLLATIEREDRFGSTTLLEGLNDANDGFTRQRYHLANGVGYVRELDRFGQPQRIGSPGVWEERQQRATSGRLQQRMPLGPGMPTGYSYDPHGRLTGAATGGLPDSKRGYAYDASGNLVARLAGATLTRYRYASTSDLIASAEVRGQDTAYAYNRSGSLSQNGATTYRWDSHQRLVRVERDGQLVAEYGYNPFGERIKKTVYGGARQTITYFLYDGHELAAEMDANARITRQYVWLDDVAGEHPIAMLQSKPGSALQGADVFAIVADHTGAPRALVDKSGQAVWRADVVGYGEARLDPANLATLALRSSSQYFDAETGLHYNTRRYLDPASGRYLSADPLGPIGDANPYAFVDGNPVDLIDPLGLQVRPAGPVSSWSRQDRLYWVWWKAADQVPGEIGSVLKELVSPRSLETTAAVFALWAGAQFTPFGWAADLAVTGVGVWYMGSSIWDLIKGLYEVSSLIATARCDSDLQQASSKLAKAITDATVAVGSAAGTAGAGRIANLLRTIFKDTAAGKKAANVAQLAEKWFGRFTPGRSRSGAVANYEWLKLHPDEYPPWGNLRSVIDGWLNPGSKIYMINLKSAKAPGGWATSKHYTSLAEARSDLSLLQEFKKAGSDCCVIQEYTVKTPIPVRGGTAGPLQSTKPPYDSYPGGGQQWQLLLDRSLTEDGGWENFFIKGPSAVLQP
jgi:RHS repeat-associated protein